MNALIDTLLRCATASCVWHDLRLGVPFKRSQMTWAHAQPVMWKDSRASREAGLKVREKNLMGVREFVSNDV